MADRPVSTVTRTVTISDLTPAEMASIFAAWSDEQQGDFFNALYDETRGWPGSGWEYQCYHIVQHLNANGRSIVEDLADNYVRTT